MEIGSITKTFSGQLLADAIARGEVKASDPLSTHLSELAGTPAGEATLEEVASHRSGIPGVPSHDLSEFVLRGDILGLNPFTDGTDQLIEKTRTTTLGKRGEFVYSNLGTSLLGEKVGYAWYTDVVDGHTIINHGGTTIEYMTHLAIDKESGKAVMIYTDQNNDGTASALATALLTDGQKISTARMPMTADTLPQTAILGAFTILALVMGLYTAARAASAPSRMAVACRAAALLACLAAAAASGPWTSLPTWILAVATLPGMYGIVRGITLWPDLPTLPRHRAWLGWMQVGLTLAFVALCLIVAWPKA